ncbi:hypothetical protein Ciccas_013947, partial [Cichlidogyrus casuarinus]
SAATVTVLSVDFLDYPAQPVISQCVEKTGAGNRTDLVITFHTSRVRTKELRVKITRDMATNDTFQWLATERLTTLPPSAQDGQLTCPGLRPGFNYSIVLEALNDLGSVMPSKSVSQLISASSE